MVWEDRRLSLQGKRRCWGDWGWLQKQRKEGWSHEVDLLVWTIVVFWRHALCIHATISSRAPRQATSAGHIWLLQTSNDWGNFPCLWSPPSQDWINLLSSEGQEEHLLTSLGLSRIYGTKLQLVFKTTVIFYLLDASLFFPSSLFNIAHMEYPQPFQLLLFSFLLCLMRAGSGSIFCPFGFRSWPGVCGKNSCTPFGNLLL